LPLCPRGHALIPLCSSVTPVVHALDFRKSSFCNLQSAMSSNRRPPTKSTTRPAPPRRPLVRVPTETVYGLGANAFDAAAVARITPSKADRRQPLCPRSVDRNGANHGLRTGQRCRPPCPRFWPGPLTLVLEKQLEKKPAIPAIVTAGLSPSVCVCPRHPVASRPDPSRRLPTRRAQRQPLHRTLPHHRDTCGAAWGSDVDYILDGGPCKVGIDPPSCRLVGSQPGSQPVLLRPGGIPRTEKNP